MSKRVTGNGTLLPSKLPSSIPAIVRLAGLEYVLSFGIKCKPTLWDKQSQLLLATTASSIDLPSEFGQSTLMIDSGGSTHPNLPPGGSNVPLQYTLAVQALLSLIYVCTIENYQIEIEYNSQKQITTRRIR
jgi:hypothetical protein